MHIVLVDPSRTVLKSVGRLLEARHHHVHQFLGGRQALTFLHANRQVGALITSTEMTPMSGLELCWEARLLASFQRPLYVILMSSNSDRHGLGEALDSGADDFIGKPPVPEELYARLRAAERLAAMQHDLIRAATTDALTGLLNRRALFERGKGACARAEAGDATCAIMVDIDRFRQFNDAHGHAVGDQVIRGVAEQVAAESEFAGRIGGEEFLIVLGGCSLTEAVERAERLRIKIASLRFEVDDEVVAVTCSLGVCAHEAGDSVDTFFKRADVALYAAKAAGRNRVVADEPAFRVANYDQWRSAARVRTV